MLQQKTENRNEVLVIAFQKFNGVILAKISNLRDRQTHAFGATAYKAQCNAQTNYRTKYGNNPNN